MTCSCAPLRSRSALKQEILGMLFVLIYRIVFLIRRVRVLSELKSRFDHFLKTGDDSKIPSDLTSVTFRTVRPSLRRPLACY